MAQQPAPLINGRPFDEFVEEHIKNLPWPKDAAEYEKSMVAGNIRHFAARLREAMGYDYQS